MISYQYLEHQHQEETLRPTNQRWVQYKYSSRHTERMPSRSCAHHQPVAARQP